jgi:hypothetical protein
VLAGKRVERDRVLLGVLEQPADLRGDLVQAGDHVRDPLSGLLLVIGVERLTQRGGDQPALVAAAVVEHVADEVHRAAPPRAAQRAGDRRLQPRVVVGDGEAHPAQAALLQPSEELDPEGARLDLADV